MMVWFGGEGEGKIQPHITMKVVEEAFLPLCGRVEELV
jgi:hypothetical protein